MSRMRFRPPTRTPPGTRAETCKCGQQWTDSQDTYARRGRGNEAAANQADGASDGRSDVSALSGLGAPRRSAGAVTSMLGAAMWIPCVVWLAHVKDLPGREYLHQRPLGWVIIWLVVACVGIVIQWTALRSRSQPAEES